MKTEIELALELIATHGYEATKKEPEKKLFAPFKGQICLAGNYKSQLKLYAFSHMSGNNYTVFMDGALSGCTVNFKYCEPIPYLVQFRPMSELDYSYDGSLNFLYANGRIVSGKIISFTGVKKTFDGVDWAPVGFQLLEECKE